MEILYNLPLIDDDVVNEVVKTLRITGWLTTGPKVLEFEQEITKLTNAQATICVSSWTMGAMVVLRWFGVGPGDEVIIPAYTYAATAMAVLNLGAKPILIDVKSDFTMDPEKLGSAISTRTKVVIPVDLGGFPCDYNAIFGIISSKQSKSLFHPQSPCQVKLGRILVLADAAHSIGASYQGKPIGSIADISVFSFHSAKNVSTGEGGAICLNLAETFEPLNEEKVLKALALNGQSKNALEKNQPGQWRYDIIDQGFKANMPDVLAAIGIAYIRKYLDVLLPERREVFDYYNSFFSQCKWAILPVDIMDNRVTSYHLYLLRIRDFTEEQRDSLINEINYCGVGVNVHYVPIPMLSFFKRLNYLIEDYPVSFELYKNEITLPIYYGLTRDQLRDIVNAVYLSYNKVIGQ